ncbi:MAG: hypothetical protein D6798_12700 [Deltaproteobacteria bacterium]|nr:MAG: hypothetical protein D6798_12700 [Deltaproteobacteria bacterium]
MNGDPPARPAGPDGKEPSPWPRVDALFAGEPPPPPVDVRPRVRRLRLLITVALALDLVGLLFTVIPGAIVTLWTWLSADAEAERIEAGTYDEAAAAAVIGVRSVARWAMVFVVVCLVVQATMLHRGYYDLLWATFIDLASRVWDRLAG